MLFLKSIGLLGVCEEGWFIDVDGGVGVFGAFGVFCVVVVGLLDCVLVFV